jgi:hypothetical protein
LGEDEKADIRALFWVLKIEFTNFIDENMEMGSEKRGAKSPLKSADKK